MTKIRQKKLITDLQIIYWTRYRRDWENSNLKIDDSKTKPTFTQKNPHTIWKARTATVRLGARTVWTATDKNEIDRKALPCELADAKIGSHEQNQKSVCQNRRAPQRNPTPGSALGEENKTRRREQPRRKIDPADSTMTDRKETKAGRVMTNWKTDFPGEKHQDRGPTTKIAGGQIENKQRGKNPGRRQIWRPKQETSQKIERENKVRFTS
jgi:hypothetical protein